MSREQGVHPALQPIDVKPISVAIILKGAEYRLCAWTPREVERKVLVWLKQFLPEEYDKLANIGKSEKHD